ncbi:MAG: 30S ribosome-binding factor RbfA [Myxococcales bacterium]|nr:30S ribosome-binding factor RbfA [Myxococcales bacterium]
MSGGNPRRPRVAQAIREALGDLIRNELSDPRVGRAGFVSINHVELNKDMGLAHIYIAFYGGDDEAGEPAVVVLNKAAGKLRGPLGRTLNLQRAPELRFVYDQSSEFGVRLSQIIRDDELRHVSEPSDEAGGSESDEPAADGGASERDSGE